MPKLSNALSLLACWLLVACGGGGDDVAGSTIDHIEARLDLGSADTVVFIFSFTGPIPTVSAGAISVVGGTKGSLGFNSDKTVYTLPVARDGNNDNEIAVSVGAAAFRDAAGNPRLAAASAAHVFESNLVWQDEFNTPGAPDSTRWAYDIGAGGWGNAEEQTYTNSADNAFVDGGLLHIVARQNGAGYTSARLKTQGKMVSSQPRHGFVEVRAELPCSKGAWPAIWMLSSRSDGVVWPTSGEIDIVEWFGNATPIRPEKIEAAVHFGQNPNHPIVSRETTLIGSVCGAMHRYQLNWTADEIEIGVDDTPYFVYPNTGAGQSVWPFDQPFHLLLNVAVGGVGGGGTIENLPYEMLVDYVRVYRVKP